jgi:hypothetical protein
MDLDQSVPQGMILVVSMLVVILTMRLHAISNRSSEAFTSI